MEIGDFKRMYRLIDYQRRLCMCDVCSRYSKDKELGKITFKQLDYLMLIRMAMPCNLQQVMTLTGLSSSAASLFIDKMTRSGIVVREQDPRDRRNILIRPTGRILDLLNEIDLELDRIIANGLRGCTEEQINALEASCRLVCRKLESFNASIRLS